MKALFRSLRSHPAPKTSDVPRMGVRHKGGKVGVEPSAPPRVPKGLAPGKSAFERAIEAVTPRSVLARERRKQNWAEVVAQKARYEAVQKAMKTADTAMNDLFSAINANYVQGIQKACSAFHDTLAPFCREFPQRDDDTPHNVLDAIELRGACILRSVQALGTSDPSRLQTLHESLEKLPSFAMKDPLIVHLAFAVKAQLLQLAMASVSPDRVLREPDGPQRTRGLQTLGDMGLMAKDIDRWMQNSTFGVMGPGGTTKPRYGNAIPGASLTRDTIAAFIPLAETARLLRTADQVCTMDLSNTALEELLQFEKEIAQRSNAPGRAFPTWARFDAAAKKLSAAITDRRQKMDDAARSTNFQDFGNTLDQVLRAGPTQLPTTLLAHASAAWSAREALEDEGPVPNRELHKQWVEAAIQSADPKQLQPLQLSLHYGDGKRVLHELSERGTVRAQAAFDDLTVLKQTIDARHPIPDPPASATTRALPTGIRKAFLKHPYPADEDRATTQSGQPISPKTVAALARLPEQLASLQTLPDLQTTNIALWTATYARMPGHLESLNAALDAQMTNGKAKDLQLAQLSLAVKSQLLARALSQTASFKDTMKEKDVALQSEGLIALIGLNDIAHEILNLKLEVDTLNKAPSVGPNVFPGLPLTMAAVQSTVKDAFAARRQRIEDAVSLTTSVEVAILSRIPTPDLQHVSQELTWLLTTSDGKPKDGAVLKRINAALEKRGESS